MVQPDPHLSLLLVLVTQLAEVPDQLQALHVLAVHKALFCSGQVQALQRMLGKQPPQPRVCVVLDERMRLGVLPSSQQRSRVPVQRQHAAQALE